MELQTLVRAAQAGDAAAFDALVRRYQDRAVGYASSLLGGDRALAEDAAQDAFLLAYRDLSALGEPAAFGAWLRRIVAKCCDRYTRRASYRAPAPPESVADKRGGAPDPAAALEEREMQREVRAAVAALPEPERTAVTLFYGGGHSAEEIARFVEATEPAVRKRLQRARARLKEAMMREVEKTLRGNAPSRDDRFAELSALLRRLTTGLEADPQVHAAYLRHFGEGEGHGPGDDAWSSLNLHVVLDGAAMDELAAGRRAWAARFGEPLLFVEGPQNAPRRGYYLMAVYDGAAGPYQVDWYWHPYIWATISADARPLFNRGVPRADTAPGWGYLSEEEWPTALRQVYAARTPAQAQAEEVRNLVSLFWAMWMISAKGVARRPDEPPLRHVEFLRELVGRVRAELSLPVGGVKQDGPFPSAAAKLAVLRAVGREMEALMPQAAALSPDLPGAAVPRAHALADLTERNLRDAGQL